MVKVYIDAIAGTYKYVFQYKGHLRKNTMRYNPQAKSTLKIADKTPYYPFLMKHSDYNFAAFDYNSLSGSFQLIKVTTKKALNCTMVIIL